MHCDADRCGQIPSELEIIVSHILPYITTPDAVRVATLSGEIRKCVISGIRLLKTYFGSTRKSLLCTTTRDTLYIHHRFRSFEGLVGALVALGGSGLVIDSIENHTEAGFDAIWNIVLNSEHLFHFSTASRILCQFVFDGSSDESGQFSNQVLIPGGSVRLFKRTLPLGHTAHAESETQLCAALGVSFHSDDVWIIRVAAVSGPLRVDLKAGATRADVLRVPNSGKGTWSDLLPVEASYCQLKPGSDKTVFLVEFI